MGFFSDIMKNPLVQMALPMALSWAMPALGVGSLFSSISNPMMRSAAEQALLGYGTAKLTGSKHPEKAAMYAGLGSMPFSFMKAQGAADAFNKAYVKDPSIYQTQGTQIMTDPGRAAQAGFYTGPGGMEQQLGIGTYNPPVAYVPPTYTTGAPWLDPTKMVGTGKFGSPQTVPPSMGFNIPGEEIMKEVSAVPEKLTAWDVLKGKEYDIPAMRDMARAPTGEAIWNEEAQRFAWPEGSKWDTSQAIIDPITVTPAEDVNFYSKIGKGQKNLLGQELTKGETFTDWTPTIASQTAGWYGGRPTAEEEWEDAKARRRKELAFMYGIDESLMGGELQNPYYTGGGFWRDGGIATLEMDSGGAVNGPGGPKDDVIDAKLSDGEFVMTAKAVENFGGGDRMAGAKKMYNMMNQLDPQSETVGESVIGV